VVVGNENALLHKNLTVHSSSNSPAHNLLATGSADRAIEFKLHELRETDIPAGVATRFDFDRPYVLAEPAEPRKKILSGSFKRLELCKDCGTLQD
jgi:hypothetical protein